MTFGDVIRILFSVLIPPLGVFFRVGFGLHFWLNILLTLLGYVARPYSCDLDHRLGTPARELRATLRKKPRIKGAAFITA